MSVVSKSSPVPIKFDSASKKELQREINDFLKPKEHQEVKINFDDELSQVVESVTSYQEQIPKTTSFEVEHKNNNKDIFSQSKNILP